MNTTLVARTINTKIMCGIHRGNVHLMVLAFLNFLLANVLAETFLVPNIRQYNYEVTPEDHGYSLYLAIPPGSKREENVELKQLETGVQELSVHGTQTVYFFDTNGELMVTYSAGKNGYTAKLKYEIVPRKAVPALGIRALKSTVGGGGYTQERVSQPNSKPSEINEMRQT